MGTGISWGLSFLNQVFQHKKSTIFDSWHDFTLLLKAVNSMPERFLYTWQTTRFNLTLVSSTWAEVQVAKGVLSCTEAPQTKVSSKRSNVPKTHKSRKLCPVSFRILNIALNLVTQRNGFSFNPEHVRYSKVGDLRWKS